MNLLFVCSSNVCRSPYCEYMFRRMAEEDPVTAGKIHVSSSAVLNQMKAIDPKTRAALGKQITAVISPSKSPPARIFQFPVDRNNSAR